LIGILICTTAAVIARRFQRPVRQVDLDARKETA
jgi:hypothetical protein